jgi:hypothetical protein
LEKTIVSRASKKTLRERKKKAREKRKASSHVWSDDASAEKTKRGERCVGFDRE